MKRIALRVRRVLIWLCLNAGLCWCAWAAAINGNTGAGRLLSFVVISFAILITAAVAHKDSCKGIYEKGRSVPAWLTNVVDISLALFLVWHGFWVSGIALAWSVAMVHCAFEIGRMVSEQTKNSNAQ